MLPVIEAFMAAHQQTGHHERLGPLDDHWALVRIAVVCQPGKRRAQGLLGVGERPPVHNRAVMIEHSHIVRRAGPISAHEHAVLPPGSVTWLLIGGGLPAGLSLFGPLRGVSLTPICRPRRVGGGRTQTGHPHGSATRPSPQRSEEPTIQFGPRRRYFPNEASADLSVALALCGASVDVGASFGTAAHAGERDGVDGLVQGAVTPAVEAMPDGSAAAGWDWADAAQGGERCLIAAPPGMGEADHGLGGADRTDAVSAGEPRGNVVDDGNSFLRLAFSRWFASRSVRAGRRIAA